MRDILSTIIRIAGFFDDFNLYFRLKSVNFWQNVWIWSQLRLIISLVNFASRPTVIWYLKKSWPFLRVGKEGVGVNNFCREKKQTVKIRSYWALARLPLNLLKINILYVADEYHRKVSVQIITKKSHAFYFPSWTAFTRFWWILMYICLS